MGPNEALVTFGQTVVNNTLEQQAYDCLRNVLRRDWAVRVLDAWVTQTPPDEHVPRDVRLMTRPRCRVQLAHWKIDSFDATSIDAARLAAAEAVWLELPESVRIEIGVMP